MFSAIAAAPWDAAASPPPEAPQLLGEPELESSNGAALLRWTPPPHGDDHEHELQEASSPSFADAQTRYVGTLPSWYVSGRLDGRSYLRVRSRARTGDGGDGPWTAWSDPQVLIVEHHDPRLAVTLFVIGAAVFLITVTTVALGARGAGRSTPTSTSTGGAARS